MRFPLWAVFIRGGAESLYSVPSGVAASVGAGSQSRPTTCGGAWAWLPRRCAVRPARDVGCPARPFFQASGQPYDAKGGRQWASTHWIHSVAKEKTLTPRSLAGRCGNQGHNTCDRNSEAHCSCASRGSLGPRVSTSCHSLGPFLLCSRNSKVNCAVVF